ncbi:RraA family protein [bacterium]|nr:RraA family protein [bacterium]RQV94094.1 MAG: RraA family protein [bacterium]
MKKPIIWLLSISLCLSINLFAQVSDIQELETGMHFIETQTYTDEENAHILDLYKGLRVADVSDGMDRVGLPGTGLVNPEIYASWTDPVNLSHQIRGIAITARYVPTQRSDRPGPGENFEEWESRFYNAYSPETFVGLIKPGTVIVLDDVEDRDIGSIGSYNILDWHRHGAVGVITDAGARDTDEIAIEKVPLYLRKKTRTIRPGRNELESVNRPVVIGGVLVCPGDIVVADGDGVIVVPRRVAGQVAQYARQILNGDKAGRRNLYERLDMPLDQTVE